MIKIKKIGHHLQWRLVTFLSDGAVFTPCPCDPMYINSSKKHKYLATGILIITIKLHMVGLQSRSLHGAATPGHLNIQAWPKKKGALLNLF